MYHHMYQHYKHQNALEINIQHFSFLLINNISRTVMVCFSLWILQESWLVVQTVYDAIVTALVLHQSQLQPPHLHSCHHPCCCLFQCPFVHECPLQLALGILSPQSSSDAFCFSCRLFHPACERWTILVADVVPQPQPVAMCLPSEFWRFSPVCRSGSCLECLS